jgi:hypothetical protein
VGTRLELIVDNYLIDGLIGKAELRMHHPKPQGAALVTDKPWEGNSCAYMTVIRDGNLYRMYYRGSQAVYTKDRLYAFVSADAIRWRRHTLRINGFVSVQAPLSGGEIITKPITFSGDFAGQIC